MSRSSSTSTGDSATRRGSDFGRIHVVWPRGRHQTTIVWLHGLGDNGSSCCQILEALSLPHIKWICPTAPTRPVTMLGGFPCTAWFDVKDISEDTDTPSDLEDLDASAAHVANLLLSEPSDVKLGIGGFSMGAALALYSAICSTCRKYGNGNPYTLNLSAIVALSGWLPSPRSLWTRMGGSIEAARIAISLPVLLCHGSADDVVLYQLGEKSAQRLISSGFCDLTFKSFNGLGHYTIPEETDEVRKWLIERLGIQKF